MTASADLFVGMSWEQIPIVDFRHGHIADASSPEFKTVVKEITDAFKNVGFVYLRNHGIPLKKVYDSAMSRYLQQARSKTGSWGGVLDHKKGLQRSLLTTGLCNIC